jgi:hypothetical protein
LVSALPTSSDNYWKSDTMFDLKYCNWNKDMLMGVLPNSQFGDVAVIDISNTDEHCVVMCIYHAVPLLDYTITGQDGQLLVTDAESLPLPEFDNIGMEVLPMTQIFNSPKASIVNLFNAGYNPRYFNWKTKLDVVNGAFTTTLKSWVSPVTESLLSGWFGFGYSEDDVNQNNKVVLNYKFFKVNPSVLDPIFGVAADSTWDTDQLLVNSYIGCYVARNLSRDGVPY